MKPPPDHEVGDRIVYDPDATMGYAYRARIVTSGRRWRCIIDQHFMGWRYLRRSRRFRTEVQAEQWGSDWLDAMETKHDGRVLKDRAS